MNHVRLEQQDQAAPLKKERILNLLKACANQKDLLKGSELHSYIRKHKLLEKNGYIASALVSMYARCGALANAQQVLHEVPVRDVVTWTALISGYVQQGKGEEALKCFDSMQREGHHPNAFTFACALKACGIIGAAARGEEIHDKILSLRMLDNDLVLGNILVDMYARCGALIKAQRVLHELPVRDVVTWTALMSGYAQRGQGEEALKCFDSMQRDGHCPNSVTFTCALRACGSIGASIKGEQIHEMIVSLGMLENDIVLGNTLVDMYARCGDLAKAQEVLHELRAQDVVTWNALMAGYTQDGQVEEALKCFDNMQEEGHSPDVITLTCALKACGIAGAIIKGVEIHDMIINRGLLEKNLTLRSSLVDMYVKCGALEKAVKVLNELCIQDVISWNALIGGYALQGQSEEAFHCLDRMQHTGVKPDLTTFVCILNTCCHSGLLDEAEMYFTRVMYQYDMMPNVEHYCCMVNLFSRAGKLSNALVVIERMPSTEYRPVWLALLGACQKWGDVKNGRFAFSHALQLDRSHSSSYVCMSNIYIAAGMEQEADKIEEMKVANEALKLPGCCWWMDAMGKVHPFLVGEKMHAQSFYIFLKLEELACKLLEHGYCQSKSSKDVLCAAHSELLAVACALVNTTPGTSILVVKNMQVCVDCHKAIAAISKIENREIKVKDAECLHVFGDGKCSCECCR